MKFGVMPLSDSGLAALRVWSLRERKMTRNEGRRRRKKRRDGEIYKREDGRKQEGGREKGEIVKKKYKLKQN
jgi:hypothetical protein